MGRGRWGVGVREKNRIGFGEGEIVVVFVFKGFFLILILDFCRFGNILYFVFGVYWIFVFL